jgi:hypothetical protein
MQAGRVAAERGGLLVAVAPTLSAGSGFIFKCGMTRRVRMTDSYNRAGRLLSVQSIG